MHDDCRPVSFEFARADELVELEGLWVPPERDSRTLSYRIIVAAYERSPLIALDNILKL